MSALRVAHLIESDGPGGAERIVAQLATALQAAGTPNVVFLPAGGEGWLARELEGSGVAIEHFRIERPVSAACARTLAAAFRRHRITVAHSHEFSMAVYGGWVSWRLGVPHVITMHGGQYYAGRLRRRLALRAAIGLSSRTVAVSQMLARHLSRNLWIRRSRIDTIPNGVRAAAPDLSSVRDELGLNANQQLIVAIGNLYPVKGHRYLIDALARLAGGHPGIHLAIAGRGPLEDELSALAGAHGLADRVHLLGLRRDVSEILAAADIFVLPSLSEGLPLALLEAMFARRPIVATDVGEVAVALAQGDAGLLVPPGDAGALAAAIDGLLRRPAAARALGERACARAAAEYDVSNMVRRYADAYRAALASRN